MSKSRELSGAVIEAMRKAGWLRTDRYQLAKDFTGEHTVDAVIETMTRDSKDYNNFSLQCTSSRKVTIPGSVIANARVIESDINANSIDGAPNVFYRDEVEDLVNGSQLFHQAFDFDDDGIEFPNTINIVGAVVNPNPTGDHPYIPLRKYKNYSEALKHHRKDVGDDTAYLTRDAFTAILALKGESRPKSIPTGVKELTLLDSVKATDMEHWAFTLIIKK